MGLWLPCNPSSCFRCRQHSDIHTRPRAPSATLRICVFSPGLKEVSAAQSDCQGKLPWLKWFQPLATQNALKWPSKESAFILSTLQADRIYGTSVNTCAQLGFPGLPYPCHPVSCVQTWTSLCLEDFHLGVTALLGNERCKLKLNLSPSETFSVSCVEDPSFKPSTKHLNCSLSMLKMLLSSTDSSHLTLDLTIFFLIKN